MPSLSRVGRFVGVLLLVHLCCGLILPYVLLGPATSAPGSPGAAAAAHAGSVRAAVFLFVLGAGLVLAGTFSALAVLPLVVLTQIGFIVAFGVLLDTFIVRSVIVPAAVIDVGDRVWWPSKLAKSYARR